MKTLIGMEVITMIENCENCKNESVTKKVVVAPKVDPRMGKIYMVCLLCSEVLKLKFDNRSDRQVIVTDIMVR